MKKKFKTEIVKYCNRMVIGAGHKYNNFKQKVDLQVGISKHGMVKSMSRSKDTT
jgi:hypothetical protein